MVTPTRRLLSALVAFTSAVFIPGHYARASAATAIAGQTVTISVTVDGTAPFVYQWFKNSAALLGANSASYLISSVKTGDAGSYYVVVSNSAGSATSDGATLTVLSAAVAPVFTIQPASRAMTAGQSTTFTAAASGSPAPTYQWKKGGVSITGATGASYTIAKVTTANAGTYTVVATNTAGSATSKGAVLTVNVPPAIVTQPASQTVTVGASVTFTATASGSPAPTYQWKKGGVTLTGATGASYTIAKVTAAAAGTYTVVVTNVAGSATTTGAVLTVNAVKVNSTPTVQVSSLSLAASLSVATSAADADGWRVAGTGDFNNDSQPDILGQNAVTGECVVWLMNGPALIASYSLGTRAAEWQLTGTDDFNGDGWVDILWQNTVTDEYVVWLMNGPTLAASVSLGVRPP